MNLCDKPMAMQGLISYRYRGRYGWIMIGAKDDNDALREAQRTTNEKITMDNLQIWKDKQYEKI